MTLFLQIGLYWLAAVFTACEAICVALAGKAGKDGYPRARSQAYMLAAVSAFIAVIQFLAAGDLR